MSDTEKLLADVVSTTVEKVLMNMSLETHEKVGEILADHYLGFSDCYRKPEVLSFALKEIFEGSYLGVVDRIKLEFAGLVDLDRSLSGFLQRLSE